MSRYNLYRDQGATTQRATLPTTQPVHAATRQEAHCDAARGGPLYGAQCITTWRLAHGVRTASAQCACSLGLGCAHCAPNPVLTQCTVYNHCLDHCSWSILMNIVHGVLKKKKDLTCQLT